MRACLFICTVGHCLHTSLLKYVEWFQWHFYFFSLSPWCTSVLLYHVDTSAASVPSPCIKVVQFKRPCSPTITPYMFLVTACSPIPISFETVYIFSKKSVCILNLHDFCVCCCPTIAIVFCY